MCLVLYEKQLHFYFHCDRLRHIFHKCEVHVLARAEDGSYTTLLFGNLIKMIVVLSSNG